jgi:tRNA G18 (ribose-2'-O)-methylase SpoU
VVSAGAFDKIRWQRVAEPAQFLSGYPGRVIATVADERATELPHFQFSPTDLLLFGSESHGLPPDVVTAAAATVTIPSRGQTQSLNLAVSLAIVLFEADRQLRNTAS